MPLVIPLIGKIVASMAVSEPGALSAAPKTDTQKVGSAAGSGNFSQSVDDAARAAANARQNSTSGAANS